MNSKMFLGNINNILELILKNKYFTYITSALLIIYIALINKQDNTTIDNIKEYIRKPNSLILIVILQIIISLYNMPIAILLVLATIATLATQYSQINQENTNNNVNNVNNANNANNTNNTSTENKETIEGFKERPSYFKSRFMNKRVEKYTNDLEEGVKENEIRKRMRRAELKNRKQSQKQNKDNFNNTDNQTNKKNSSNELSISRRTFDLDDKSDKNIIKTREICKDIINRINYEYEDNDYLLKYISSRIEEIIDINNLLDTE